MLDSKNAFLDTSGNEHALTKQSGDGSNLLSNMGKFSSKTPTAPSGIHSNSAEEISVDEFQLLQ